MRETKFKMIYIPIILLLFTGTIMVGLPDYLDPDFQFKNLIEQEFLTNVITTNVGILCMIISILLLKIDKFKTTDPNYLDIINNIRTFYKSSEYSSPVFAKYCSNINPEYKKEAYLEKKKKQYTKIKLNSKQQDAYENNTKIKGWLFAYLGNKKVKKKKRLEYKMSDEYINKHLKHINIRHNTISERLIFSGVATDSSKSDYITKYKGWKVFKDLLPKFLLGFAITTITTAVVVEFKDGITASVIYKTISKLVTITSQLYFAVNYADDKYNPEVTLGDVQFRNSHITGFRLWVANKIKNKQEGVDI